MEDKYDCFFCTEKELKNGFDLIGNENKEWSDSDFTDYLHIQENT